MDIDIKLIIFQIVNTLILFFILKKILFKPVTKFLDERSNAIESKINKTEEDLQAAAKLKAEYEDRLKEARQEAMEIMEKAAAQADKKQNEIISLARVEAERIRQKASEEIEVEKEQALIYLRDQLAELATSAASVVIEKNLDPQSQANLIDRFIEGMDGANEK
jgi:F-type H+-transporting ATPase subunit b